MAMPVVEALEFGSSTNSGDVQSLIYQCVIVLRFDAAVNCYLHA